jgi:AcrR family transcriptional regulator
MESAAAEHHDWTEAAAHTVVGLLSERRGAKVRPTHQVAEQLVSSALTLFAERGFDAVTVNEIAARAGVTARTFFRYYPTKETVVVDLFDRANTRLVELIEAAPGDDVLPVLLSAARTWFTEYEDFYRAVSRVTDTSTALQSALLLRTTFWEDHLAEALGVRFPHLDDDARWAIAMGTFGVLRLTHRKVRASGSSYAEAVDEVFQTISSLGIGC